MSKKFAFKLSQRFRVCVNNVSFYATKKEILSGVGDFGAFNLALQIVFGKLEVANYDTPCGGFLIDANGFSIQLNVAQNS